MPTSEELRAFRESAEQLQALREQLAENVAAMNAIAESGETFRSVLGELLRTRAAAADMAAARQTLDEFLGTATTAETFKSVRRQLLGYLSSLPRVDVDAGRLDALLEQMQRTDRESEELVDRAERVRERLKTAAS